MKINEIASAAEQLALWKLISDNTWAAIAQQARQEAERQAAAKRTAKTKPKRGGHAKASAAPYAAPLKPLPTPKPLYPTPTQSPPQNPIALAQKTTQATTSFDPIDAQNEQPTIVSQQDRRH